MPEQESQEGDVDLPDDEECETEFEKTVTMVGYDSDLDFPSLEEWAEQLTGEPCTETTHEREEKTYLVYDLGFGEQRTRLRDYNYDDEVLEEVKSKLNDLPGENVRIETVTKRSQRPSATLNHASKVMVESLFNQCVNTLSGGMEKQSNWTKWAADHGPWKVRLSGSSFEEQRVLAKESERSSDDRYETMSEVPTFTFVVTMKAPSEELIDLWTEEVIKQLHKLMSSHEDIGKVRYMSCTVTQEKAGECYAV